MPDAQPPDADQARPLVLERLRRSGLLVAALLVPLLALTLAVPRMPLGLAVVVLLGGLAAVLAWRRRQVDRDDAAGR